MLAGIDEIGLAATDDADALLALRPDCVVYAASGPERDAAAVPRLRADARGRHQRGDGHVGRPRVPGRLRPGRRGTARRRRRTRGGASLYASGIEPGFAGDQLVLTLATQSNTIRSIRTQELFLYDEYPVTFMMFEVFGFGKPLEHTPLMATAGAQLGTWGPPVQHGGAHALGVELDTIRETYERQRHRRVGSTSRPGSSRRAPSARSAWRRSASSTAATRS